MTERTYRKDLEVLAEHFRRELMEILTSENEIHLQTTEDEPIVNPDNDALTNLVDLLFTHLVPIYNFHLNFLRLLEQRISIW